MADKVMRMADPAGSTNVFFKPANNTLQRKCQACEEEEKHVHRKENDGSEVHSDPYLDNYISSLSSSGQKMSDSSRNFFEPRLGHDFSGVRLHTDSVAAKSARSINALAYTSGNNIVFNSGQYSPESDSGKKLMAHELTHVIQQGGNIQPKLIQRQVADVDPTTSSSCRIHFVQGRTEFTDAQEFAVCMARIRAYLAGGGDRHVVLHGFASTEGTSDFNQDLSRRRAETVLSLLRSGHVDTSRITISAHGEDTSFPTLAENRRVEVLLSENITFPPETITVPRPAVITSQTVVTSPGARTRTTIGVGEEVTLTLSTGTATTVWAATAGTFLPTTGQTVVFSAPDTAQNVTVSAGGATLQFIIIAPNDVHMDPAPGTPVKHVVNRPSMGMNTVPFLLPDNVNFNKVINHEMNIGSVVSDPGAYSCFAGFGHCRRDATVVACNDIPSSDTVVAGKGTQTRGIDCVFSGDCTAATAPFVPGSITFNIPYEYKVGTGPFRQFVVKPQVLTLAADANALTADKAGAHADSTVTSASTGVPHC